MKIPSHWCKLGNGEDGGHSVQPNDHEQSTWFSTYQLPSWKPQSSPGTQVGIFQWKTCWWKATKAKNKVGHPPVLYSAQPIETMINHSCSPGRLKVELHEITRMSKWWWGQWLYHIYIQCDYMRDEGNLYLGRNTSAEQKWLYLNDDHATMDQYQWSANPVLVCFLKR